VRAIDIPAVAIGHSAPITSVALRADGLRLATSSYDGNVIVWDVANPDLPRPLTSLPHRRLVNATAWNPVHPKLLATASADKTAVVWEVNGRDASILSVLARHTDDLNSVAWLPDGRRLACVSEDGDATIWDALSGRFLSTLISHTAHCMMVACSQDGLVATVGEDGMVAITDPDTGTTRTRSYAASVEGCAWSHSDKLLAVARDDGIVDVLDRDLSQVRSIPVSSSSARAVAWSDDDSELIIGAYDGAVHFVSADGRHRGRFDDDRLWPRSVTAGHGLIVVGSFWSTPCILDQRSHAVRYAPAAATYGPNAMAVRRERELVIGCDSGDVAFVGLGAGAPGALAPGASRPGAPRPDVRRPDVPRLHRLVTVARGPVLSLAAHDGDVAAGTYSGRIAAIGPGEEAARLGDGVGAPLPAVLCGPDLITGGTYDGDLIAVDRRSLVTLRRERAHAGSIKSLAGLDAEVFVSGATDRSVAIGTLTQRQVLWEHGNLVNSVAVLGGPGGAVVASASRDHTVKVGWITAEPGGRWRVGRLETLIGPDESVKCVGLLGTPEAPVVLAGSYDFGLYAWSLARGRGRPGLRDGMVVSMHGQGLSCICRIDARSAAVAGWDGRVSVVALRDGTSSGLVRQVASFSVPDLVASREAGAAA
jgi:toxoflavin biosynthesis protein ToxC